MKVNYVNPEHVHAVIDLPTSLCVEEVMHLLKGESAYWVNQENLTVGKFAWGRGYGAFSVSESQVGRVASYVANQEEHHRKLSFAEELRRLVERHGLRWHDDDEGGNC